MVARSVGLILVLAACTSAGEHGLHGEGSTSQSTPSSSEQSQDEISIDRPVLVGGTFLTCAAEYQDSSISMPTFGCRLASNGSRIPVPDTASANIDLLVNGSPVSASTQKAPADSFWQWIVTTSSKGPFDAKLTLKDVSVAITSSTLVITEGNQTAEFEETFVAGSKLAWGNSGETKVLTIDTDNGNHGIAQKMPTVNFMTAFPRHVVVSKAATSIIEIGFYLTDGSIKFCRYIRSASDPSYFVYSTADKNCGTAPQNNPTQVTPITEPLDAVTTGIMTAYIQGRTEDNVNVSLGSFKANAVLRPFAPR